MRAILAAGALALLAMPVGAVAQSDPPVPADVRAFHQALLVLDTHLDTPVHFERFGWDITQRHSVIEDATQVDLPRMVDGGLDGGFWVIYTPKVTQDADGYAHALAHGLRRAAQIHRFVADHADSFEIALTAADAPRIAALGKRIVYISMENSAPLGLDLANLAMFHQMGVTMAGPVHSGTNQFADSATGDAVHGGLSALGRQWVVDMNRLGMVIDASHSSDAAFDQMLALSKAPIILSHSGPKAIFDHPRNLDDERMRALAARGGVMQVNSVFVRARKDRPAVDAAEQAVDNIASLPSEEQGRAIAAYAAANAAEPSTDADFDMFMESLFHTLDVMGVDHVGLGADWDGGGGVAGMADIVALPRITQALLDRGYSRDDVAKIWSGNVLRVLAVVQAEGARERGGG